MLKTLFASTALVGVLAAATPSVSADPDARAAELVGRMTVQERVSLLHGTMPLPFFGDAPIPTGAIFGAGYITGVERLGVPALKETDASLGVSWVAGLRGDGATALPSGVALAATWDPALAYEGGVMIGSEARAKGFNVLLAGGVNLTRDPRNGRNFEYLGEDPLLAGILAGESIRGVQSNHIISTIKHFAFNGNENGRNFHSTNIGEAAGRESDLLAFQIAIERGQPGSVMCAYNRVNDVYACENPTLLNDVLKRDWGYKGWVMSDWGAVHSTAALLHGLDQQSGEQLDRAPFFGSLLLNSLSAGEAGYAARVDDAARRIVRTMAATGLLDNPVTPGGAIDFDQNAQVARRVAERGIVLLRNEGRALPLARTARNILVIGDQADVGVLSGGGSSQVAGPGGPAATVRIGGENALGPFSNALYHASSPLAAIKAEAPNATVRFATGRYPAEAVHLAKEADVVIAFVGQWTTEAVDVPDLSLPNGQDALIEAVAAANPNTIVVLQTGGPVAMPWLNHVPAVLEAWYSGAKGGEAIADILFGDVNPSGHLPVTFPAATEQLPRPVLPGIDLKPVGMVAMGQTQASFPIDYNIEGSDIGYRWFKARNQRPLFPFGFGLSYTDFAYSDLKVEGGQTVTVRFKITNTGSRAGTDVPQVYLSDSPVRSQQRLIGFEAVTLEPGQSRSVSVTADRRLLADWDEGRHGWALAGGVYRVFVGEDAATPVLEGSARVRAARLRP
ncbi:MAG: glycoside hydrolase family 3 C-terminal domain-containing protein [Candidatus Brevundimonas colombiensis]|uniref:Glycoside hydrolase family 3 C-terminal domain-containing protein n=1 Tax=Candidatus Brevundimonas colombiensis TaxID=3121376 RepID=A0AAJ6BMV3_9CAUL|nr:glycoside hydrolase family 3 C-terminal domain-containing protein [Brevundimonas sp.]WEK41464.1 MAG: glycoside hydrolase family 3 C-terminal domain-containing protein [Brevundimonas sp.]